MTSSTRRRRGLGTVASLCLLAAVAGVAGPASVAPSLVAARTRGTTPAAAPALPGFSQLLDGTGLAGLLQGLLGGGAPGAAPVGSLAPDVASRVAASTVRVLGVACGTTLIGSGFAPAADTVVTNAHVVAGMAAPQVQRPDGRRLPAQVQLFDPNRDLAVLGVAGLGEAPLPLGPAVVGTDGAVFGHPQGQAPVAVVPARITRRVDADIDNIYGQPTTRQILVLSTILQPGDSGGPLVDGAGRVVGVAFAVSSLRRTVGLADVSDDVAAVLAQPRAGAVSTGPCVE
jgi:S1-C subfamily serine protease